MGGKGNFWWDTECTSPTVNVPKWDYSKSSQMDSVWHNTCQKIVLRIIPFEKVPSCTNMITMTFPFSQHSIHDFEDILVSCYSFFYIYFPSDSNEHPFQLTLNFGNRKRSVWDRPQPKVAGFLTENFLKHSNVRVWAGVHVHVCVCVSWWRLQLCSCQYAIHFFQTGSSRCCTIIRYNSWFNLSSRNQHVKH
jgi:hypothetical protein